MSTSGRLIDSLSDALRLPRAIVMTTMKGLRPAEMISVRGRGTSAAHMTSKDAAILLMAIGSQAATSHVAAATRLLMDMPYRFGSRPDLKGFSGLRQTRYHAFYSMTGAHNFFDGLNSVIEAEIKPDEWYERADPEEPEYNAFDRPEDLSLTIGMDLEKSGGFALLQTGSWNRTRIFNVYSTWEAKPRSDKELPDLFTAFDANVSGVTAFHFRGNVLDAAVKAINEHTERKRSRKPRTVRLNRR